MLSLSRLMANTPADVVARSRAVDVWLVGAVERRYDNDMETVVFKADCRARTEDKAYQVVIELYPPSIHENVYRKPSLANPAFVSCQCAFFLFNCEVALARVGSSEVKYSNGKRPAVTNPRQIAFLCKHLYAAAPDIMKEMQKLASKKMGQISFK